VRPFCDGIQDELPIADIDRPMLKTGESLPKAIGVPGSIALRSEEIFSHIVIQPMDFPLLLAEKRDNFAAD
jgi:hypothetical protein